MYSLHDDDYECPTLIFPQPPKGVANYFLLVLVTRGIASFASLIRSSPRYVSGTPKGVSHVLNIVTCGVSFSDLLPVYVILEPL